MFLFRQKIRGKPLNHQYGKIKNLPNECSKKQIEYWLEELKKKNIQVIEEIVLGHMKLALNIASQYSVQAPKKINDIVSEAVCAIFHACYDVMNGKFAGDNLTAFLISKIHSSTYKYIKKDRLIYRPSSTYFDQKNKGLTPPPIIIQSKVPNLEDSYSFESMFALKEMIAKSIKTEQEKEVIDLRAKSYNDREIGQILNLSATRIRQIRADVEKRFLKLEGV